MKLIVTPNQEVVDRALALNFDKRKEGYFGESSTMALLLTPLFEPHLYLGTVTILKHRIRPKKVLLLGPNGPRWSGYLVKIALKILGTRRVRIYLPVKQSLPVLFLGTPEGTVAIAPKTTDEHYKFNPEEDVFFSDYWRASTSRFKRKVIFSVI